MGVNRRRENKQNNQFYFCNQVYWEPLTLSISKQSLLDLVAKPAIYSRTAAAAAVEPLGRHQEATFDSLSSSEPITQPAAGGGGRC